MDVVARHRQGEVAVAQVGAAGDVPQARGLLHRPVVEDAVVLPIRDVHSHLLALGVTADLLTVDGELVRAGALLLVELAVGADVLEVVGVALVKEEGTLDVVREADGDAAVAGHAGAHPHARALGDVPVEIGPDEVVAGGVEEDVVVGPVGALVVPHDELAAHIQVAHEPHEDATALAAGRVLRDRAAAKRYAGRVVDEDAAAVVARLVAGNRAVLDYQVALGGMDGAAGNALVAGEIDAGNLGGGAEAFGREHPHASGAHRGHVVRDARRAVAHEGERFMEVVARALPLLEVRGIGVHLVVVDRGRVLHGDDAPSASDVDAGADQSGVLVDVRGRHVHGATGALDVDAATAAARRGVGLILIAVQPIRQPAPRTIVRDVRVLHVERSVVRESKAAAVTLIHRVSRHRHVVQVERRPFAHPDAGAMPAIQTQGVASGDQAARSDTAPDVAPGRGVRALELERGRRARSRERERRVVAHPDNLAALLRREQVDARDAVAVHLDGGGLVGGHGKDLAGLPVVVHDDGHTVHGGVPSVVETVVVGLAVLGVRINDVSGRGDAGRHQKRERRQKRKRKERQRRAPSS